ncbi:IPT/TIG domain-containing protein [Flavihumibacter petaseus]|uniref:IPT/TIG domain-containing protein n=1 Tax=Flavihumibacter petaseus NBRC 106054 TaxID=1220578 RepID=A0A0E9MZS9_9BACT|nr:IPT/TIG domain-containing protein [Flavihumibacter petaseus]GAO43074.1 hypothetical protein FPE01S_02_01790 [Flavihumibacter petaseus NBRC 106054]
MYSSYIRSLLIMMTAGACLISACKKDSAATHADGAGMTVTGFTGNEGGGGTTILINGSNFSTDTSAIEVTINGNRLALVGASMDQIMAVIPSKCGSGTVKVKVGSDQAESTEVFHYIFTRTVSTLAGSGQAGFANGKGEDAMFSFNGQSWYRSMGIAVNDEGYVFVADPGNHCIRKIDPDGNVSVLAGDPNTAGFAEGQGSAAKFNAPYSLAIDPEGNLYAADPINWDVRKITPEGYASVVIWGAEAPWSTAFDSKNNKLYYTGANSPASIYAVDGDGSGHAVISGLNYPAGIAFDQQGNLFVSGHGDNVVKRFAAETWTETVIAGAAGQAGYVNGAGTTARFSLPWGIATDASGNVYIAGNGTWDGGAYNPDQSIRFIEANTWTVSTFAGSGNSGFADAIGEAAAFAGPGGVAVDKNGVVYVLDKNNNRVRKIVSE